MMDNFGEVVDRLIKELDFTFLCIPDNHEITFHTYGEFCHFLEHEIDFWTKYQKALPNCNFSGFFTNIKTELDRGNNQAQEETELRQHLKQIKQRIQSPIENVVRSPQSGFSFLFSNTAVAKRIEHTQEEGSERLLEYVRAHLKELTWRRQRPNDQDILQKQREFGTVDAYLDLFADDQLEKKLLTWRESSNNARSGFSSFLTSAKEEHQQNVKSYENLKGSQENLIESSKQNFNTLIEQKEKEFYDQKEDWEKRIKEFEEYYREKLKLEAPAKRWEDLEKQYRNKGIVFIFLSVLFGVVLSGVCFGVIYKWPPEILKLGITDLATVKGAILLLIGISVPAYFVSLMTKFAISSFHLASDAKERNILGHLFLSLMTDKAVENDLQKQVILQALFSRADSGLLKGDHGPVLPLGNLVNTIGPGK